MSSITFFTSISIWENHLFYKTRKVLGIRNNTVNINMGHNFCPPKNQWSFILVAFIKFNLLTSKIVLLQLLTWWWTWLPELCFGCNMNSDLAETLQGTVYFFFVKLLQRRFRDAEQQNVSSSFHVRQDIPSLNTSHRAQSPCAPSSCFPQKEESVDVLP